MFVCSRPFGGLNKQEQKLTPLVCWGRQPRMWPTQQIVISQLARRRVVWLLVWLDCLNWREAAKGRAGWLAGSSSGRINLFALAYNRTYVTICVRRIRWRQAGGKRSEEARREGATGSLFVLRTAGHHGDDHSRGTLRTEPDVEPRLVSRGPMDSLALTVTWSTRGPSRSVEANPELDESGWPPVE